MDDAVGFDDESDEEPESTKPKDPDDLVTTEDVFESLRSRAVKPTTRRQSSQPKVTEADLLRQKVRLLEGKISDLHSQNELYRRLRQQEAAQRHDGQFHTSTPAKSDLPSQPPSDDRESANAKDQLIIELRIKAKLQERLIQELQRRIDLLQAQLDQKTVVDKSGSVAKLIFQLI